MDALSLPGIHIKTKKGLENYLRFNPHLDVFEVFFWADMDQMGDLALETVARLCPGVREIDLVNGRVTDAGLAALSGIASLASLKLSGAAMITDAGLETLSGLPALHTLRLAGAAGVTDAGVKRLGRMPTLRVLALDSPAITDDGLGSLPGDMAEIDFTAATGFTDRGLQLVDRRYPFLQTLKLGGAEGVNDETLGRLAAKKIFRQFEFGRAAGDIADRWARLRGLRGAIARPAEVPVPDTDPDVF